MTESQWWYPKYLHVKTTFQSYNDFLFFMNSLYSYTVMHTVIRGFSSSHSILIFFNNDSNQLTASNFFSLKLSSFLSPYFQLFRWVENPFIIFLKSILQVAWISKLCYLVQMLDSIICLSILENTLVNNFIF